MRSADATRSAELDKADATPRFTTRVDVTDAVPDIAVPGSGGAVATICRAFKEAVCSENWTNGAKDPL